MSDSGTGQRSFFFDEDEILRRKGGDEDRASQIRGGRRSSTKRKKEYNCETCGLFDSCLSPKMEPYGKGEMGIVVVGEAPGRVEDELGRPFVGPAGVEMLRPTLQMFDVNLDRDCVATNVIQCRPPKNRFPGKEKVRCCSGRLHEQLYKIKPGLIFALGRHAIDAVLQPPFKAGVRRMRGRVIPSRLWQSWVACCYHPAYVLRMDSKAKTKQERIYQRLFEQDVAAALGMGTELRLQRWV